MFEVVSLRFHTSHRPLYPCESLDALRPHLRSLGNQIVTSWHSVGQANIPTSQITISDWSFQTINTNAQQFVSLSLDTTVARRLNASISILVMGRASETPPHSHSVVRRRSHMFQTHQHSLWDPPLLRKSQPDYASQALASSRLVGLEMVTTLTSTFPSCKVRFKLCNIRLRKRSPYCPTENMTYLTVHVHAFIRLRLAKTGFSWDAGFVQDWE